MKKSIAVVVPAFNEAAGIEPLLWRIARALDGVEYGILVVDDGSGDATAEIVSGLADRLPIELVRHEVNAGYGAALRTGLLAARSEADVVVTMDADGSHDPLLIRLMAHGVSCGSDVIVASRFAAGGRSVGVPVHRRLLSHVASFVFRRVLRVDGIRDYTSGFRAYRGRFLDDMVELLGEEDFIRENGSAVGIELLLKADQAGASLAEVPLVLRYDRRLSSRRLPIAKTLRDYAALLHRVESDVAERAPALAGREPERKPRPGYGVVTTVLADAAAVFLAFGLSFLVYSGLVRGGVVDQAFPDPVQYAGLAAILALTTGLAFLRFGLYAPRLSVLHLNHLQLVVQALTVSVFVFFAVLFLAKIPDPSRLLVGGAIVVTYPIMLLARGAVSAWLRTRLLRSTEATRVLIYGAGGTGRLLAKKILEAPRLGSRVVGFLDDELPAGSVIGFRRQQLDRETQEVQILGTREDLARAVSETGATELYVAIPDLRTDRLSALRAEAEAMGLEIAVVPRLGAVRPDLLQVDDLGSIPVIRLHHERPSRGYALAKRALDVVLTVLLLPVALPLGLVTAGLVALDGRPVLFRQTRIGRHGRPFTVVKFRTMHPDVDPYGASPATDGDPRITRIGRLVRTAGLDEIPQLLNVLRGEMSLVGPRPEMPHIVARYGELERQRLTVRPGISGLWQISPDRSQAIHDNLEYDLFYLRQQRISFDLLILGETAVFVVRAFFRSVIAAIANVERPADLLRRTRVPPASGGDYVLVALDQRRRPDEPASWTDCIPKAADLARDCRVKVVVAEKNASRIFELAGGPEPAGPGRPEYVRYGRRDDVAELARNAGVVVTDLDYVADWASERGVRVYHVEDGRSHPGKDRTTPLSLVRQVEAAFGVGRFVDPSYIGRRA